MENIFCFYSAWVSCYVVNLSGGELIQVHSSELKVLTVCVGLVLDSEYVQFQIICCHANIIGDIFEVDPHSSPYKKHLMIPTNTVIKTE